MSKCQLCSGNQHIYSLVQKIVLVFIVTFYIFRQQGMNLFVPPQIKLYEAKNLTNQMASFDIFLTSLGGLGGF